MMLNQKKIIINLLKKKQNKDVKNFLGMTINMIIYCLKNKIGIKLKLEMEVLFLFI